LLSVAAAAIELAPAEKDDDEVQEIAFIDDLPTAVTQDRDRSTFVLAAALKNCYDREAARVNANVAHATHGETVAEILGSGDARVPNAGFALRQSPLTFVSAATPSGRQSTLSLRANDLLWEEAPSLYARGPTDRVYEIGIDDEAHATVQFGDGVEGARLPSGNHNIRAKYRKGLGLGGNVTGGKLTNLLSRPLGVTGATNPEAAGGGEDPETEDKARTNAPLTVLTLERAVSVRDYQDFARAFAGIAKAHAFWVPGGPARGVLLTIAGEAGAPVPTTSDTYRNLQDSLHRYGDPLMPLTLVTYRDARFRVRLNVKVAADAESEIVLPAIEARLRQAFGFDARGFGQGVSVDEVEAVVQNVGGVEAVHVPELHRGDAPVPVFVPRLFAALPLASLTIVPLAAELLTLDDAPLQLDLLP
jgi:predicted phage baseplate assembly protein